MFRYKLYAADGDEIGEASYAVMIRPEDEIHLDGGRRFRVIAVVPWEPEDESPYTGLLQVVAA